MTVSRSRTATGSNPRESYRDRGPRKWPSSFLSGSLCGYPSIQDAPRWVASAITRSSSAAAILCRRNGGATTKHDTPITIEGSGPSGSTDR
jgi:hypothetical protein